MHIMYLTLVSNYFLKLFLSLQYFVIKMEYFSNPNRTL